MWHLNLNNDLYFIGDCLKSLLSSLLMNSISHDWTTIFYLMVTTVLRTLAMPADTNANGDIFGGWIMSQMDIGGAILAKRNCLRSRCYCKCNRHYLSKTCSPLATSFCCCTIVVLKPVTLQLLLILKCGLKSSDWAGSPTVSCHWSRVYLCGGRWE